MEGDIEEIAYTTSSSALLTVEMKLLMLFELGAIDQLLFRYKVAEIQRILAGILQIEDERSLRQLENQFLKLRKAGELSLEQKHAAQEMMNKLGKK